MSRLFSPLWNAGAIAFLLTPPCALATAIFYPIVAGNSSLLSGEGYAPPQPVPFSHEHHVGGLGIDCRYCHTSVEHAASAGMPPTETCMNCHRYIWMTSPVLAPLHESEQKNRPLRWRRVYDLPDFVYFNHSIHIQKGISCQSCHGRVDTMPAVFQASSLHMRWCLDCHRDPEAHVGKKELVFKMGEQELSKAERKALMAENGIKREGLTDCVRCHR